MGDGHNPNMVDPQCQNKLDPVGFQFIFNVQVRTIGSNCYPGENNTEMISSVLPSPCYAPWQKILGSGSINWPEVTSQEDGNLLVVFNLA